LLAILPIGLSNLTRGLIVAVIMTLMFRTFYERWLGGITGDLIGAAGEIVEAATLIALVG
jgi:cobalamin synthase